MALLEIAAGTYLLGSYAYHRWFTDDPPKLKSARELEIPKVEEGGHVPLIFGRCRVRQPWLAWMGAPVAFESASLSAGQPFMYAVDLFYVTGIGFGKMFGIESENRLRRIFVDDYKMRGGDLQTLTGEGTGFESAVVDNVPTGQDTVGYIGGIAEFLNGGDDQLLVEDLSPFTGTTFAGVRMVNHPDVGSGVNVPSFRGYLSVFLSASGTVPNGANSGEPMPWNIGSSPQLGAYSFEVHSYPHLDAALGPSNKIGEECNPADAIYNLLTGTRGKMGVPTSRIDLASFEAAAATLAEEGHGYSRAVEDARHAGEVIDEILRQIDGLLYEDPDSDTWKLKLVRLDYTLAELDEINPDNCSALKPVAIGGRTNVVNLVRVVFTSRDKDYRDDSALAHNQAGASGQDGTVNELTLQYPGVCTLALAKTIAARELSARSRPIAKCRAVVDRTLVAADPGNVVKVTWPEYGWSSVLFRIVAVDRGERESSNVTIDLIQEPYLLHRDQLTAGNGTMSPFPTNGEILAP